MARMTPRQRVLTAVNHEEPDRIPLLLGASTSTSLTFEAYEHLRKYLGIRGPSAEYLEKETLQVTVEEEVLQRLKVDTRIVHGKPPRVRKDREIVTEEGSYIIDEWGVKFFKPCDGSYYDIVEHPLYEAELDSIEEYPWPDPEDMGRIEGVGDEARELHENTDFAVVGSPGGHVKIFEQSWYLRGFEQLLCDMLLNPKFVHALFRKVTDLHKAKMAKFLSACAQHIDIVRVADDLGSQRGPLISPDLYREMLRPYHAEFFGFTKEMTDAKLFLHSDGDIYPLLGDLVEIGVDIIEPVQPKCGEMIPRKLKEEYGEKLCFCTGVDPYTMSRGERRDVVLAVRDLIKVYGPGGGFILGPVNDIQSDVAPENIVTVYEVGKEYGVYPV